MAKIALIGGSGFIGSHILTILSGKFGHDTVIIDLKRCNSVYGSYVYGDVREPILLAPALEGVDVIINLAAVHADDIENTFDYYDTNVRGAEAVCSVASSLGINNIIFMSSVAVYGGLECEPEPDIAISIDANDYGRSKLLAESAYRRWFSKDEGSRSLTIIRPSVVFGPRNRGNFYRMLKFFVNYIPVQIGDGGAIKSVAFVENLAEFVLGKLHNKPGIQVYNYADHSTVSIREIIDCVNDLMGRPRWYRLKIPKKFVALSEALLLILLKYRLGSRWCSVLALRLRKYSNSYSVPTRYQQDQEPSNLQNLSSAIQATLVYEFPKYFKNRA